MANQKITAIEYIRGIAMLGVIGIHTGAYSLTNPFVNVHLFAFFEIFTRFSVPIFFFISAFGLFFRQDLTAGFDYRRFMGRRFRTVLLPYLAWSLLYMLHYSWISGDTGPWHPALLFQYLVFGLASYQLYFLVILLWFYTLMPLWRLAVRRICAHPVRWLSLLFIVQILFNYYSSYLLTPNFSNPYINIAIQHRLSYWVLHYLFIFIFGAVCAVRYQQLLTALEQYRRIIRVSFLLSLAGILAFYYFLLFSKGYTPEQAVNTAHQLSPIGVIYTLTATLYLLHAFTFVSLPAGLTKLFATLGRYSYSVYLVHPLVMYYLIDGIIQTGQMMTAPVTLLFFVLTVALSLTASFLIEKISVHTPLLGLALTGSTPGPRQKELTGKL